MLKNINVWLLKLKRHPVLFTGKYNPHSVLKVFASSKPNNDSKKAISHIMRKINKRWDSSVHDVVVNFLPVLRKEMFFLNVRASNEYRYDLKNHYAEICLSHGSSPIIARCITGTLIYDRIDGEEVYTCYSLSERNIGTAACLHHEIFHHLVISLEMDEFPYFNRLVKVLKGEQIDGSYLLKLKEIYTDMDEFRNITGMFVDTSGNLYFDPCSEAAYLCAESKYVRGTHKSGVGTMKYIPISFVNFLRTNIQNLKLKLKQKQETVSELKWC